MRCTFSQFPGREQPFSLPKFRLKITAGLWTLPILASPRTAGPWKTFPIPSLFPYLLPWSSITPLSFFLFQSGRGFSPPEELQRSRPRMDLTVLGVPFWLSPMMSCWQYFFFTGLSAFRISTASKSGAFLPFPIGSRS